MLARCGRAAHICGANETVQESVSKLKESQLPLKSEGCAVVRKFVLLIPLIYIMPHMISDSTTGVYMAEPIADITAVIFTSVLFTFQFKKALAEIQN